MSYRSRPFLFRAILFMALTFLLIGRWYLPLDVVQLVAFPILFSWVLLTIPKNQGPSFFFYSIACIGALFSVYNGYHYTQGKTTTLLAPFEDDEFQTRTHIFRDYINGRLAVTKSSPVARFGHRVRTKRDAQEILSKDTNLNLLLWGKRRWINVSFQQKAPIVLNQEILGSLSGLALIPDVSEIGISAETDAASYDFLAFLIAARNVQSDPTRYDPLLRLAASTQGHWTTNLHRAYVYFLLGNLEMERLFQEGTYESGHARCATTAFGRALDLIRNETRTELYQAITNNKGVLRALQGYFEENKRYLKQGIQAIRRVGQGRTPRVIRQVAKDNLLRLRPSKKRNSGALSSSSRTLTSPRSRKTNSSVFNS